MNVFTLFETKNYTIENIKLGLAVVKTLDYREEFYNKFGVTYTEYSYVFNKIVIPVYKTGLQNHKCWEILENHCELYKISKYTQSHIIGVCPELIELFDYEKLQGFEIQIILAKQPQLYKFFDLNLLSVFQRVTIVAHQQSLESVIDLSDVNMEGFRYLINGNPYFKTSKIIKDYISKLIEFKC